MITVRKCSTWVLQVRSLTFTLWSGPWHGRRTKHCSLTASLPVFPPKSGRSQIDTNIPIYAAKDFANDITIISRDSSVLVRNLWEVLISESGNPTRQELLTHHPGRVHQKQTAFPSMEVQPLASPLSHHFLVRLLDFTVISPWSSPVEDWRQSN